MGGTLTFATGSPWGNYNPFKPVLRTLGTSSNMVALLIHSRLVSVDSKGQLHPDLAERWEVSPDATTYTYTLRKGVTFSDGKPVTAKDVEATVRLCLTKAANINPLYWIDYLKGGKEFYEGTATDLPGLTVPDDYTVRLELKAPYAGWDSLSVNEMNILPAHIYKDIQPADLADEYAAIWFTPEAQIGSGPFKFVNAVRDQYIELARNDTHYGGKPKLDRLLFKNFGKEDTQYISFEKGEIDVWNVPPDYMDKARSLGNATLHEIARRYIRIFKVNYQKPYLADKRVRQALLHAIDRQTLIDQLYGGLGKPWNSFVESDQWATAGLNQYEYNPGKARQLLREANWNPGQTVTLGYYYNDTLHRDWMAAIQQQLALVGVKAQPELSDSALANKKVADCDYDLMYFGWGYGENPAVYGPIMTCDKGCTSNYCNPRVEELFAQGRSISDEKRRHEIYDEIQRIVNEELPILPMMKFVGVTGVNKRVSGFNEDALWMMHNPWNAAFNNAVNWAVSS